MLPGDSVRPALGVSAGLAGDTLRAPPVPPLAGRAGVRRALRCAATVFPQAAHLPRPGAEPVPVPTRDRRQGNAGVLNPRASPHKGATSRCVCCDARLSVPGPCRRTGAAAKGERRGASDRRPDWRD